MEELRHFLGVQNITTLRKVSICFAIAGILLLAGNYVANWMGVPGRIDRTLIIFPLLVTAVVLKYIDAWRTKKSKSI